MAEDLAKTNEQNIKDLEKIDKELTEKVELLKQEFKLLDEKRILKNGVKIGVKQL